MKAFHRIRSRGPWQSGGIVLAALSLIVAVVMSGTTIAQGGLPDLVGPLHARQEIEDLGVCYAYATDAIGRGDVAQGKALYNQCFTPDAIFEASYPSTDPNSPPDFVAVGPNNWANVVDNLFRAEGYVATQHLVGNFRVDIQGKKATMTSYLNATHVLDPFGSIDLANGTYVDQVVQTPKGWRIAKRSVRLISFLRVESPAPR